MWFDWDPEKAAKNRKKHKVSFEMACTVFQDPLHLSVLDPDSNAEERWITVGKAANQDTLIVVHVQRFYSEGEDVIRIISARYATRKEKQEYEEGI